jgi:hypothetical protein
MDFILICSVIARQKIAERSHVAERQNTPMLGNGWNHLAANHISARERVKCVGLRTLYIKYARPW